MLVIKISLVQCLITNLNVILQDTICCKYLSLTLLMMGKILP